MSIKFKYQKKTRIPEKRKLIQFLKNMLQDSGKKSGNISIIFCDDPFLLNLNKQYLKHDYLTDILTFEISERGTQLIDAEIYISSDRVFENAMLLNIPFLNELYRVLFHGILHLAGFSDAKPLLKKQMTLQEDFYLDKYIRVINLYNWRLRPGNILIQHHR